jgi:S1-C subfamily serine protease
MSSEQMLNELLDNYVMGNLSVEEVEVLQTRMREDADFRKKVEQHVLLVESLKLQGTRKAIKHALDEAHLQLDQPDKKVVAIDSVPTKRFKKYWPISAVAASVALISILGTLHMTRSLETKQSAYYKELRRNVEQIQKSQKIMMKDIAETRGKEKPNRGNYAGTAFLISANGYLATSYHLVKEADSVYIENEKYGSLKAVVVYSNPLNDVSILRVRQDTVPFKSLPFVLTKSEANLAEEVYTLGFPREDVVFGEGSVSALSGYKQNPNAYQISVPVNPGNSGGPLLNNQGDLIGMISGFQTETSGAAFAIKSTVLLDVVKESSLDTVSFPLILSRQNTLKNNSRIQQVKRWKDFVFMVRVYKN